jgi:hypothetical protein
MRLGKQEHVAAILPSPSGYPLSCSDTEITCLPFVQVTLVGSASAASLRSVSADLQLAPQNHRGSLCRVSPFLESSERTRLSDEPTYKNLPGNVFADGTKSDTQGARWLIGRTL